MGRVRIPQFRTSRFSTILFCVIVGGCVYYSFSNIRASMDIPFSYSVGTVDSHDGGGTVQNSLDVQRMLRNRDSGSVRYTVPGKDDSENTVAKASNSEKLIPRGNESESPVSHAVNSKDAVPRADNSEKTVPSADNSEDTGQVDTKSGDIAELPWCPEQPGVKDRSVRLKLNETSEEALVAELGEKMQNGGHFLPSTCRSREHLAIIIPYRDREHNLHILLRNLLPFLWRQMVEFTVFLAEQSGAHPFNKGVLFNAAYRQSQRLANVTCWVMQDADLLPMDHRNLYRCADHPRHLCLTAGQTHWPDNLIYPLTFGGALAVGRAHMERVNGFSVAYYGWGLEDDDLALRLKYHKRPIVRYPIPVGRYYKLDHEKKEPKPQWVKLKKSIYVRSRSEGLNTLNYTLLGLEARPLYTRLLIQVPPPPPSIYTTSTRQTRP